MRFLAQLWIGLLGGGVICPVALAGPYISTGDLVLRHDIQRLADAGIVKGPTTTWPLAWGPVMEDIRQVDISDQPPVIVASLTRVSSRATWETRNRHATFNAKVAVAEKPTRIRGFQNTPRGRIEVSAGASWTGDWLSAEVNVQAVDSNQDSEDVRFDNSLIGGVVGNWSIAASTQDRWWGPGWDGSLILSNNARPIPSLVIDRVSTDSFVTRWLSWLGPWDFNMIFGQMESDREIPNTRFWGMRLNFKPSPNLEIGLSRTAQWCGDGRPCNAETFFKLILGQDNRGGNINLSNEPGNQLAGFDFRWAPIVFGQSVALYGQFVGEDEAGGFPSRWMGQLGGEWSGYLRNKWSTRIYAEFAGTSCQFHESSELFNCAYNHSIYSTGYRFRARSVGHGVDNDTRLISVGSLLVDDVDTRWRALLRFGALNRGGAADSRNTLTPSRQDIASVDLSHSRVFLFGVVDIGVGYEATDDLASGESNSDSRFYVQWRSSY